MKNKMLKPMLMLFASAFCVNTTFALQTVKVKDGDTVTVRVSGKELTRLTAIGNATKISDVWAGNDYFSSTTDADTGSIIIKTKRHSPPMFSFFVKDDTNSVYTVIANQQDIPSETIQFRNNTGESILRGSFSDFTGGNSSTRKHIIRDLVKGIYENQKKYFIESLNVRVHIWKETDIQAVSLYQNQRYKATKYIIKNTSDSVMVLQEDEFLKFGDKVVAVSIENKKLKPSQSTHLVVVRESN